jgi:signal transduction histidine kinase
MNAILRAAPALAHVPQVTPGIHDFRHSRGRAIGPYNGRVRNEKWLNLAAYATWIVSSLPTMVDIARREIPPGRAAAWAVAFAAFGAAFAACGRVQGSRPRLQRVFAIASLTAQGLAGLAMVYLSRDGTQGATLVVSAAVAAAVFEPRGALLWTAGQTAVLGAMLLLFDNLVDVLAAVGAFGGFQAFAVGAMTLARRERVAREELVRAHADLVATQSLLAENTRIAERLRISRDLHDTLGHHLTALSLRLDVASRLTSGQAEEHVREAHAVTRLLLADVRDVVSRMRESGRVDLAETLRTLAADDGGLRIHFDIPESFPVDEAGQAHALLRSVQEIITNARRHGGARNLWIRLERRSEGLDLHARDDGRGAAELKVGNGLTGMRERFEEFAGRVEFTPGAGRGFEVHGFMPRPETAT